MWKSIILLPNFELWYHEWASADTRFLNYLSKFASNTFQANRFAFPLLFKDIWPKYHAKITKWQQKTKNNEKSKPTSFVFLCLSPQFCYFCMYIRNPSLAGCWSRTESFWFFIAYLPKNDGNWKMVEGCRLAPILSEIGKRKRELICTGAEVKLRLIVLHTYTCGVITSLS